MAEPTEPNGSLLEKTQHILGQYRNSRKLVLLIVAIGLLLDNMLLTSVGKFSNDSELFLFFHV